MSTKESPRTPARVLFFRQKFIVALFDEILMDFWAGKMGSCQGFMWTMRGLEDMKKTVTILLSAPKPALGWKPTVGYFGSYITVLWEIQFFSFDKARFSGPVP